MTELNVFYLDESPVMTGKYLIRVKHEEFHCKSTVGSYNILPARLFGITYANYLRLARDEYGAVIYGKGTNYPVAYFDDNAKAHLLVKSLNKLASIVEWERTHPEVVEWAKEELNGN